MQLTTLRVAAFFTKPSFTIHGPQTMDALQDATVYTTGDLAYTVCAPFAKEVKMAYGSMPGNPGILRNASELKLEQAFDWMRDSLKAGETDAICLDASIAHLWELQNCGELVVARNIKFGENKVLLLFHAEDAQLARDMKAAIAWYRNTPAYFELERRHLKAGVIHGTLACFNERTNGRTDGRTNKRTNERTSIQMST